MSDWTNASPGNAVTATTAGVLRPRLLAEHVAVRRWPTEAPLDRFVENYWGLRWQLPAAATHPSEVLAHPTCNLSLERATDPRPGVPQRAALLTGVSTQRFDVPVAGAGAVLGVKFRPGGLAHLLGTTAQGWTDRVLPARDALPQAVARQLEMLDPGELFDDGPGPVADLLQGLVDAPVHRNDARYASLIGIIRDMLADRSLVSVHQVSQRHGLSERTLQRWFGAYLGVGPKWVLGRYRMHDVVTEIDAGYTGALTDLAYRYGWYDQAHFIRDFRNLVGVMPSEYAAGASDGPP